LRARPSAIINGLLRLSSRYRYVRATIFRTTATSYKNDGWLSW
jgi:hypothetical protein